MNEIPFVIFVDEDNHPCIGIDVGEHIYNLGPASKENIENLNQCFLGMLEKLYAITGTVH